MTPAGRRVRVPTLESLFVAAFALLGLRLGLRPLGDNSLFLHLRTGIDLVRTGHVPTRDPYSFTAPGHPWVVQSWLAEAAYGVAHRLGGFPAVRVLQGLLYGVLAWLVARLARAGTALRTALAASLAIGMGVAYWSPRPLVFGLLGMAVTVWIVRARRSPWLLVPLVWVWVNTHGSFVLGLAWLVAVAIGQRLDGDRRPEILRWIGGFAAGLAVACINPLGPKLLTFPLAVLGKREVFAKVVEWRSPSFQTPQGLLTLACIVGVVVVLARPGAHRRTWRDLLPVALFLLAGLSAQRNLPMLAVVVAPVLADALRVATPVEAGTPAFHRPLAALLAVLAVLFVVSAATEPGLDVEGYPQAAARLVPVGAKVASSDIGGCFLLLARRDLSVLVDDRVDMYPERVTKDYLRLLAGKPGSLALLDRYGAEAVVWEVDTPLVAQLAASDRWRRVGVRDGWVVYLRR